jgi:hypothetical protein
VANDATRWLTVLPAMQLSRNHEALKSACSVRTRSARNLVPASGVRGSIEQGEGVGHWGVSSVFGGQQYDETVHWGVSFVFGG